MTENARLSKCALDEEAVAGDIVRLTTEPQHWSNETADAAVQAAIEARALMLATARALGLADEDVEQAPQRAAELVARLHATREEERDDVI